MNGAMTERQLRPHPLFTPRLQPPSYNSHETLGLGRGLALNDDIACTGSAADGRLKASDKMSGQRKPCRIRGSRQFLVSGRAS